MLSNKYIATLWFALAMLALVPLPANGQTILFEDFEAGWGSWSADNGVWGVGTPTAGPAGCFAGTQCAGTVLGGNYPVNTDSRLISPTVTLPGLSSGEEVHVIFESWFDYGDDWGWVQISTWDGATGNWSDWQTVGGLIGNGGSPVWSLTGREISAHAGETVRIAFFHTSDSLYGAAGWYVDDVTIVKRTPAFGGDFESGWGDWYTENGMWEVGTPTVGPAACYAGSQCVGTVLDGTYPATTDSRLISPTVTLPGLSSGEEIHVIFESWFDYGDDWGWVQISTWDGATGNWSDWQTVGGLIGNGGSPVWSLTGREISAHAGETVRIAFLHTSDSLYGAAGWYVDDVTIVKRTPAFGGDFESGWGDWYTENGIWEVGTPPAGPAACYAGSQCVGTVLDGTYPTTTDSRLISPTVTFNRSGTDPITLRFFHWFAYGDDLGRVQISSFDSGSGEWSVWTTIGPDITDSSSVWSPTVRDLTAYDGESVRIAFLHTSDSLYGAAGWFIDNIVFTGIVLGDDVLFKDGFE